MSIAFFTPCGGGVDYEFLLGSIEHHASMGSHVVLDNTPVKERRYFKGLPSNVIWIYDDEFNGGKISKCRFRQALDRAMRIARLLGTDYLMHLDCDEFLDPRAVGEVFPKASGKVLQLKTANWGSDGNPHVLPGYSIRIWDSKIDISYPRNEEWPKHRHYDGNPDRHPMPKWGPGVELVTVDEIYHHHLHYALQYKVLYPFTENPVEERARVPWPKPIENWKSKGIAPSSVY